jgi:iron complex outermembrane recepter protein
LHSFCFACNIGGTATPRDDEGEISMRKSRAIFLSGSALPLLLMWASLGYAHTGAPVDSADTAMSPYDTSASDDGPSPTGDSGLQEIVITANKREQSLNSVGLTVTALSADALAERKLTTLADIAEAVPGLSLSPGPTGAPVLTLRGVGFNDRTLSTIPSVAIYLDEAPLPFAPMATQTAFDLERIEVLKGPQGTLFGQSATGGAINYVSAKPTDTFRAGADLSYGRYNTVETNAYVSGPLSDTVKARVAVHAIHGDDWQQSFTRDDTLGKTDAYAGRFLLDAQPLERLRLQLDINGWRDRSDPEAPQVIADTPQITSIGPFPFESVPLTPQEPRAADWTPTIRPQGDKRLWSTNLRGDFGVMEDLTLTSLTTYTDYEQDVVPGGDGFALNVNDVNRDNGTLKSFSQELRVANNSADRIRYVIGGTYDKNRTFEDTATSYKDGSSASVGGFYYTAARGTEDTRSYAGFGNIEADVTSMVTLKGGARYTDNRNDANICAYDPGVGGNYPFDAFFTGLSRLLSGNPNFPALTPSDCVALLDLPGGHQASGPPFRSTLQENNVSWRTGVDFKPTPGALLYVNVSKGYKAGNFPVGPLGFQAQLEPVTQESLLAYEGGFKLGLLDRRLQVNGAIYYYDYTNKQQYAKIIDPLFGAIDALVNIPKSSIKGAELEVTAVPVNGLTLDGQVLYTDAKVDKFVGINGAGQAANFAGSELPFVSKLQLLGSAEWKIPVSWHWRPFVGGNINYRSSASATIGAELALPAVTLGPSNPFEIHPYTLVDLRAGVETADGRYRVYIFGKNVFDKLYAQNQYITYDNVVRLAGPGATWGVTLDFKLY